MKSDININIKKYLKKAPKATTVAELMHHNMVHMSLLGFLVSRFAEYSAEQSDWEFNLASYLKKLDDFLAAGITEPLSIEDNISYTVDKSLDYLMTCPLFTMHEFAEAGAKLTNKEMQQFKDELIEAIDTPSKRAIIFPYTAAAGFRILTRFQEQSTFQELVEKRRAEITNEIGIAILIKNVQQYLLTGEKAEALESKLRALEVTINLDGTVSDPHNRIKDSMPYNQEKQEKQDNQPKAESSN